MLPYNLKIWGLPASQLDVDWLHKVPPADVAAIVASCRKRRAPDGVMPSHARFYYPRHGGFQAIFDAILEPVRDHVLTGVPVVKLQRTPRGWLVNNEFEAGLVVNTAPWPVLAGALAEVLDVETAFAKLTAASIVVSLWTRDPQNWRWNLDQPSGRGRTPPVLHRQLCAG